MLKLHIRLSLVWATPLLLLCPSAQAATLVSHLEESPPDTMDSGTWGISASDWFCWQNLKTSFWPPLRGALWKGGILTFAAQLPRHPHWESHVFLIKKSCEVDAMIHFSQMEESWFREIRTLVSSVFVILQPHSHTLIFCPSLPCSVPQEAGWEGLNHLGSHSSQFPGGLANGRH